MKNTKLRRFCEEFSALDLYDEELKSIEIAPRNSEKNSTIVELLPRDSPVRSKLASLGSFARFKINFHGGTMEVLVRRFTLRNPK